MAQDNKIEFKPLFINTVSGERIKIEKLTWKQEREALVIFSNMIEQLPSLQDVNLENLKIADIISTLPALLQNVPELLTDMVAILMKKEVTWVDNNLDFEGILEISTPFFEKIWKRIAVFKKVEKLKISQPDSRKKLHRKNT